MSAYGGSLKNLKDLKEYSQNMVDLTGPCGPTRQVGQKRGREGSPREQLRIL